MLTMYSEARSDASNSRSRVCVADKKPQLVLAHNNNNNLYLYSAVYPDIIFVHRRLKYNIDTTLFL